MSKLFAFCNFITQFTEILLTEITHGYRQSCSLPSMAQYAVWSSLVLANIGFLFISVSTGTDFWVSRIRPSFEANEGLFFRCVSSIHASGETHRRCERLYDNFGDFPGKFKLRHVFNFADLKTDV